MPRLKIAHLCQQGQNMVIVPLDSSFGCKSQEEQAEAVEEFSRCVHMQPDLQEGLFRFGMEEEGACRSLHLDHGIRFSEA
jgi:hypothetical protein